MVEDIKLLGAKEPAALNSRVGKVVETLLAKKLDATPGRRHAIPPID